MWDALAACLNKDEGLRHRKSSRGPGPGSPADTLHDSLLNMPRTDKFQASEASTDPTAVRWVM